MDIDYIVKVKKDANMELTSGSKERARLRIIGAVEMLIASFVLFIFFLYERTGSWIVDIFPGCFILIGSIILFIDFSWKMIIDNSGIYVKKYNKTHRINFEELTDIRIESHIIYTRHTRSYRGYFVVIEFFNNDKIKKISLLYKKILDSYKDTDYHCFHDVSDEDVDKLMNLFIKKSQINENNKDIEQYKDIRTQNTNAMIEEKIEQGRKTIETEDKIMIIVAFVAVLVVLGINVAVMVLLLK